MNTQPSPGAVRAADVTPTPICTKLREQYPQTPLGFLFEAEHLERELIAAQATADRLRAENAELRQRIADALNAAEQGPKLSEIVGPWPNRDPDRVRLAAAALQGIMTHREAITQISTRDPLWAEKMAVERADATLSQLDATAKKGTP